jgi:hypothetical protein
VSRGRGHLRRAGVSRERLGAQYPLPAARSRATPSVAAADAALRATIEAITGEFPGCGYRHVRGRMGSVNQTRAWST